MFTTAYPGIHVPAGVFQGLMTALDFHNNWLVPPSVPCEKRDAMSNVTLNLGGQDLMLTPYDYTQFWDDFSDMPQCYSMFTTSEPGHRDSNKVILGWAFLRAFYSVFDQGEGVVRFASLS
ncbi:aspartic peptidase domain-containing protein [Echria macrotheca]|uniref:Aspartic peptidase domain-containing protein n=1 Tax=Echria macrotheca TaxID=438768 RepID=A0AAJ0F624_9PEZI|nr:aspartic peptidase domain-containing protein [Echria macrotheca]